MHAKSLPQLDLIGGPAVKALSANCFELFRAVVRRPPVVLLIAHVADECRRRVKKTARAGQNR